MRGSPDHHYTKTYTTLQYNHYSYVREECVVFWQSLLGQQVFLPPNKINKEEEQLLCMLKKFGPK